MRGRERKGRGGRKEGIRTCNSCSSRNSEFTRELTCKIIHNFVLQERKEEGERREGGEEGGREENVRSREGGEKREERANLNSLSTVWIPV